MISELFDNDYTEYFWLPLNHCSVQCQSMKQMLLSNEIVKYKLRFS